MVNDSEKQALVAAPAVYHGLLIWLLAALVMVTGLVLSLRMVGDSGWLARSGCVVVMLGIWSGLGSLVRESILNKHLALRHRRARRRLRVKYRLDAVALDEALQHLDMRFTELNDKHQSKLQLSVGVQEAVLLLTGTFVWGFGDLIRFVV